MLDQIPSKASSMENAIWLIKPNVKILAIMVSLYGHFDNLSTIYNSYIGTYIEAYMHACINLYRYDVIRNESYIHDMVIVITCYQILQGRCFTR